MAAAVMTVTPPFDRARGFGVDPIVVGVTEWGNVYEVPPGGATTSFANVLPADPAFNTIAIGPMSTVDAVLVRARNQTTGFVVEQLVTPKSPIVFPPSVQAAAMATGSEGVVISFSAGVGQVNGGGEFIGPLLTTQQRSPAGVISTIDYARMRKPYLQLLCYQSVPEQLIYSRSPLIDTVGETTPVTIPGTGVVRGWPVGGRRKMRLEVTEMAGGASAANLTVTASTGLYLAAFGFPTTTPIPETTVATAAIAASGSAVFELEVTAELLFLRAAVTGGTPTFQVKLRAED